MIKIAPPRICRFYNQPGGCNKGDQCSFLHQKEEQQQGEEGEIDFPTKSDRPTRRGNGRGPHSPPGEEGEIQERKPRQSGKGGGSEGQGARRKPGCADM